MVTTRSSAKSPGRNELSDAASSSKNGGNNEVPAHPEKVDEVEYDPNYPVEGDTPQTTGVMSLQERIERLENERAELVRAVRSLRSSAHVEIFSQADSSEGGNRREAKTKDGKGVPTRKGSGLPPKPPGKVDHGGAEKPAGETTSPPLTEQERITAAVKAALEELTPRELRTSREKARQVLGETDGSPFVSAIATSARPKDYIPPSFSLFDGKTDPAKHIKRYKQAMAFWLHDEPTMCRQFAGSLGDKGLDWFYKLPSGKIGSFAELAELFTARFLSNRPPPKEMNALFRIFKRENESLRAYFNRYWEWCSDINCDVSMKVSCFRDGLPKSHPLTASLVKKPPKDYNDLSDRLEKYILLEENDKASDRRNSSPPRRNKDKGEDEGERRKKNGKGRSGGEKRGDEGRDDRPTGKEKNGRDNQRASPETSSAIFNMPIGRIMHKIKGEEFFQWSRPLRGEPHTRD